MADAKGFHEAIQKRSMERMNEQRNHWENLQEREIDALVESISSGEKKLRDVNKAYRICNHITKKYEQKISYSS